MSVAKHIHMCQRSVTLKTYFRIRNTSKNTVSAQTDPDIEPKCRTDKVAGLAMSE